MSKAIEGAAMLGAAVGMSALAAFVDPALIASPIYDKAILALAAGGIAMEAGAIADALTQQRGMNITTRQPAQFRQLIYGTQRVGGVMVYQSTTGSHHDQYNMVIILATHQIQAIENLYLDGRRVFWDTGSTGNTTRNGYNFGGSAGGGTFIGPNGQHYNFDTLVYCEARFGDQAPDDVIGGLTANDPNWATNAAGSPWLGGCAYIYLKVEYDAAMFPQFPEIRLTVHGKSDIFDPRTGLKGYSTNPALIVGDILADPTWGLGDNTVNQSQLTAAANVCDEQLACAPTAAAPTGSLSESRYSAAWHYDTSTPPGEAIKVFLETMGGRLTRSGGQWFIWPAYYQGPTAALDENALLAPPQWNAYRKPDELYNRVNGTYTAPNYPYNVAGDLYDANGWYDGSIQNNFPFAFQASNFPQYAADYLHGYSSDGYLNEDSGATATWNSSVAYAVGQVVLYGTGTSQIYRAIAANTNVAPFTASVIWNHLVAYTAGAKVIYNGTSYTALTSTTGNEPDISPTQWQASPWITYGNQLPLELDLKAVLSVSQSQRLAKIKLLRNRQQGTGLLKMKVSCYTLQGIDTFQMTFPPLGWSSRLLEVSGEPQLSVEGGEIDEDGKAVSAPAFVLSVPVQDTDPAVYAWSIGEELTVYDVPSAPAQAPYTPAAPTGMTLVSGASTAVVGADGITTPRVLVEWTDPLDIYVTQVQVQFRNTGSLNPWQNGPTVAVGLGQAYVIGVVAAQIYDFRIRSLRANGATSTWVEIDGYTVSLVLSIVSYTGIPVAQAALTAIALAGGTATIQVGSFTANYGGTVVPCTPSPNTLPGLVQNALYYVYYIDPSFAGGVITPIATQNQADFLNKAGYILIGQIMTPNYAPLYRPTNYSDVGSQTTSAPAAAYDGNTSTFANVLSQWTTTVVGGSFVYPTTVGDCIWGGFAGITLAAAATLNVLVTPSTYGTGTYSMQVILHMGGTPTVLATFTAGMTQQAVTATIPSGTNLGAVSVELVASVTAPGSPGSGGCSMEDAEMWIQ